MGRLSKLFGLSASLGLFPRAIYSPLKKERIRTTHSLSTPTILPSTFTLVSWNIQYCASRKLHFFYDGGPHVHASKSMVQDTMNQIGKRLAQENIDIITLQEVDRCSKRTQGIDQFRGLKRHLRHYSSGYATYFKAPFVPIPTSNPLGKVHTDLVTLASVQIQDAYRYQLALLKESKLRQAFNLKRAILETEFRTAKGPLFVANTHLSAFSYQDGTQYKQVQQLQDWINTRPAGARWIITGDFNLLPIGDIPERLLTPQQYHEKEHNPLSALIPKYKHVFVQNEPTYLPYGHSRADRKLDFILYSEGLKLEDAQVWDQVLLSDHLALWAKFSL